MRNVVRRFYSLEKMKKLYPNNSTLVWIASLSAIIISFLAITVVPLVRYENVEFSPTLMITWLTATAIILTLAVSFENLRELKIAREHQFKPILNLSDLSYNSDVSNQNSNVHSTHITFNLRNSGEGKAIDVNSYLYLRDHNDIQWVRTKLDPSAFDLKSDEDIQQKTTFGNLAHPRGDDVNIVLELTYYDSLGKKYNIIKTYNYQFLGPIVEVDISKSLKLKANKKVQIVENQAKEKARKLASKYNKEISVEVRGENQEIVHLDIQNGEDFIGDFYSLILSTDTIVENAFARIEL